MYYVDSLAYCNFIVRKKISFISDKLQNDIINTYILLRSDTRDFQNIISSILLAN